GSNFVNGCTLTFHDPQNNPFTSTATFVSSSQLTHSFNNSNDAGTWTLYVTNPDGHQSNTINIEVTHPATPSPLISSLDPPSYAALCLHDALPIYGSNFVNGCTLTFHDPQNNPFTSTATFVSSSQLTHSFNNSNDAGTWTLYVTNPDGHQSNTI